MVFCHTFCAWGLSRPPPCSGTIVTILVLGDCRDYSCAQGLSRPPSCSGTVQTTIVLGNCPNHSRAWGLPRLLSDHCLETTLLGYM